MTQPQTRHARHDVPIAAGGRYASIIDVHMILRRGGRILLLRRTGDTFASGRLCLPSGHLEEGESITTAVIRETREETGICLDPAGIRHVLSVHQRYPGTGHARIGFAFEPSAPWHGEPVNAEPHKHSELIWADPAALPADTIGYAAAIIHAVQNGDTYTLNGW